MKIILRFAVLAFLLVASASRSFAMISVEDVSKERAKALGVTFRAQTNGMAGIKIWMEFKAEGELEKITYVELQIGEPDGRIMSAVLPVSHAMPGKGVVTFSAFPDYVRQSTLMIVVYNGPKGDVGYRIKVKDFVDLKKIP